MDALRTLDEAIIGFRVATQRPRYRQRLLSQVGLEGGIASLRVLRSVERSAADPSISQVAADLGVEHSTASRSVASLVRAGLLKSRRCEDDQRQARLQLTERGQTQLDQATRRRQEILGSLLEEWGERDVRTLARLLNDLRHRFDEEFGAR